VAAGCAETRGEVFRERSFVDQLQMVCGEPYGGQERAAGWSAVRWRRSQVCGPLSRYSRQETADRQARLGREWHSGRLEATLVSANSGFGGPVRTGSAL